MHDISGPRVQLTAPDPIEVRKQAVIRAQSRVVAYLNTFFFHRERKIHKSGRQSLFFPQLSVLNRISTYEENLDAGFLFLARVLLLLLPVADIRLGCHLGLSFGDVGARGRHHRLNRQYVSTRGYVKRVAPN
jgi:hypothetical protein